MRARGPYIGGGTLRVLGGCQCSDDAIDVEEQQIMAAYLIVDAEVSDPVMYEQYRQQVAPLIGRFGGRFLVRGGEFSVLEGHWRPRRLVVVEFPDTKALQAWYGSAEYAPLLALRQQAAQTNLVAVLGVADVGAGGCRDS
jgi:uncharacterized protein (DUF1330 family)